MNEHLSASEAGSIMVSMGIRSIGCKDIYLGNKASAELSVQVEGDSDGYCWPHNGADCVDQVSFRVLAPLSNHGPVQGEHHRVQWSAGAEIFHQAVTQAHETVGGQGPPRDGPCAEEGNGLKLSATELVEGAHKATELGVVEQVTQLRVFG